MLLFGSGLVVAVLAWLVIFVSGGLAMDGDRDADAWALIGVAFLIGLFVIGIYTGLGIAGR